jgi:glutamate synthase (NADPH/NADH) large chain
MQETLHPALGLYHPDQEHDSCGIAFIVDIDGGQSHDIIARGMQALVNMEHRGASGSEAATGDGAGITLQNPDTFWREILTIELPSQGAYGTGIAFLDRSRRLEAHQELLDLAGQESLEMIGTREVPINPEGLGPTARAHQPLMTQYFFASTYGELGLALERRLFVFRKRAEHLIAGLYFPSLSTRTFTYKGMLTTPQLQSYFSDLTDERLKSAIALVHSRFSTNTFPSWSLAQPFRLIAHNGEINTVRGNRNWMATRQSLLKSDLIPGGLERAFPIVSEGGSDSASFDEVLELLTISGRSMPHAVLMMIPEAWENHGSMDPKKRAFYQFHASLMEPWDGPASIAFTDGTRIGAVLDRNGLRPSRYWVTSDRKVIMASEVGVVDLDPGTVIAKGRLQPGKMFLVDTELGRIVTDEEIKSSLADEHPYQEWIDHKLVRLETLPPRSMLVPQHSSILTQQRSFGYTTEELRLILLPMARSAAEPLGSMGSDTPSAILSQRPRMLFDYFVQLFAQVTNPPLDAIREELVTASGSTIGPEADLLHAGPDSLHQIHLPYPLIDNDDLAKLMYINESGETPGFTSHVVDCHYPVAEGGLGLASALGRVHAQVADAITSGANIIILSDRHASSTMAPIPSLLSVASVHHRLIADQTRTKVGLVVETGDAREIHHMALLLSYGAGAINPYLAFDSIVDLIREGQLAGLTPQRAIRNYIKAACKGVIKVMSKMGISTIASYTGAQVFEAIGLASDLIATYFPGTSSRIGGANLDVIAAEVAARHTLAHPERPEERAHRTLEVGGEYQWRREGEYHLFNPETVFRLQHATRTKRYELFRDYTRLVDDQSTRLATLRGLFTFKSSLTDPVPLEEVEPTTEILKRFSTGAMSYGSISPEAHETLAIAMNRLGGRSNTGEGGEDPERYRIEANGDSKRSAIKQVASGRFGVTSEYLVNADDIQIKMAQGAKPGEGGQLPGEKVYPWIAKTRHSTPGVGLISPPPHHDIYSIEDLAQLIYDLKSANSQARIHVKLVSQVGVGTVAAGVAKAHADVVLISGADGGTGASPLTSLKHAGSPWELGLAETQQTLLLNGLRDRITVQVDGQLKTGRDVIIAALLGAEEFGFASAPLVVSGCIMMRVCHLDTCPVGIATQNPELRKRYSGRPEFVETFFEFIAEEVREYLAQLGLRSLDEAVGRVDLLDTVEAIDHWKAAGLDLSSILTAIDPWPGQDRKCTSKQDHGLELALDNQIISVCEEALTERVPVEADFQVRNINRSVGTMIGSEVTRRYGGAGLDDDTIVLRLEGSAGQSLGAFLPKGITIHLRGDANDYVGKGLSGGRITLRPPITSPFVAEHNVIAGNVLLYGATGGELYIRGIVGERFAVRNSGALAVVEGIGDHGCEYMTGGLVIVLGEIGRNFGAGMSGGIALLYDPEHTSRDRVNLDMVEIESLTEEDQVTLQRALIAHRDYTGSVPAQSILDDFNLHAGAFVKIFPKDYKAALAKSASDGIAETEASTLEGHHG